MTPAISTAMPGTNGDLNAWRASFEELQRRESAAAPPWLAALRRRGWSLFEEHGMPRPDQEEWRFTSAAALERLPFQPALEPAKGPPPADLLPPRAAAEASPRLVFVDGFMAPAWSRLEGLPDGVRIRSLAEVMRLPEPGLEPHLFGCAEVVDHGLAALNMAFFEDGAVVEVAAGVDVPEPIHVIHLATGRAIEATFHLHHLWIARPGSRIKIIEHYESALAGAYVTNVMTELVAGEDAIVEHGRWQAEGLEAVHVASVQARLGPRARFASHSISAGARLARHDFRSRMEGEGGETLFNGLYLGMGEQIVDHHTTIDHAAAHCGSHQHYHGILDGRARGVFNGKIMVRPGAQKTDAKQTNRNLLLSKDAMVHTKPQLEIFADDVRCTHGATVGQLDADALFFLRARGLDEPGARRLLMHAFAADILDRVSVEAWRERLDREVMAWFESLDAPAAGSPATAKELS